jgi:aryl-alcohol dehydrogenase-like predicted oxidoreductase
VLTYPSAGRWRPDRQDQRSDLDKEGDATGDGQGRRQMAVGNGFLNERGLGIAEVVKHIAAEGEATPSQVAIASCLLNPAVTAPIVGAHTVAELDDNLGALHVELDAEQQARLAEPSAIDLGFPHDALRRMGFTSS